MTEREPTIRARELGLAVSRAARAKGMNGTKIARRLGWTDSKVSRLFAGKYGVSREDLSGLLVVCGIVPPKRDELMELARHAYEPGWWQDFGDRVPVELTTLSDHEDSAVVTTQFETDHVPGLLQTEDYMRVLMRTSPVIPDTEIDTHADIRKRRQRIFDRGRSDASFRFFINEYALTRTGPGPAVMTEHLHHLLRMSVRPHVEIRVIPDRVGFHAARKPFHMMEFSELNPVVFIEDVTSAQFLEREDTITVYRRINAALDKVALDRDHSRAWMRSLAASLAHGDSSTLTPDVFI